MAQAQPFVHPRPSGRHPFRVTLGLPAAALALLGAVRTLSPQTPEPPPKSPPAAAAPAAPQSPMLAAAYTPEERDAQPAEKVYKNIKVLTSMPAGQMLPVMHLMRAALGVHCDFCHVAEEDKWELDTKKEKETARQMIRMMMEVNKNFFEGRTEVTCNTCHQGHEHPTRQVPIGQALFADTTREEPPAAPAEKRPAAAEVLDRYLAALGGRAALEGITSRVSRGTLLRPKVVDSGTPKARAVNRGQEDPLEIVQQAPNKITVKVGAADQQFVQSFDGAAGKIKTPRGERAMTPAEVLRVAAQANLRKELALRERADKARVVGKDKIEGREVVLVRIAADDGSPALLAFDAQTGLLRRSTVFRSTVLGPDPEQTDYEDYRDAGSVKVPFLVKTSFIDDNHLGTTRKLTEVRHNVTP